MAKAKAKTAQNNSWAPILTKIGIIAFIVVFVAILAFTVLQRSTGILHRTFNAVKVGDETLSAMDMRIIYKDTRAQYLSQYGYILQLYGYDLSTIDSQSCMLDSSITWGEYFSNQAMSDAVNILMLNMIAENNGYEISDDVNKSVEEYMASVDDAAATADVSVRKYLKQCYGTGTSVKDLERVVLLRNFAADYYEYLFDGYFDSYKAEDVQKYYESNKDTYDVMSYYSLSVPFETFTYTEPKEGESVAEGQPTSKEDADKMTEEAKKAAKELADKILAEVDAEAKTDVAKFDEIAKKYWSELQKDLDEDEKTEFETALTSGAVTDTTSTVGKWYSDKEIKKGDSKVLENTDEYTVVLYVERIREEIETVDVRHILISASAASENATAEQKAEAEKLDAEAKAKAEALLADYNAGAKTEDSFAALAKENSEDSNASKGGIYENVAPGDMVEEFNDWIFDESRKAGDVDIVKTDYGYHVMYFVGEGLLQYEADIRTVMADEAYGDFFEEQTKGMELKTPKIGDMLMNS